MASISHSPIIFKPFFKSVIWGGNKICSLKGIPQNEENIGESWEISQIPGFESIVAEGEYQGLTITELIDLFDRELLGNHVFEKYGKTFPLLVKFIDANDNLSIQVHPDDTLARERHQSAGKTEMWYILSSEKDAKIYAGLKESLNPEKYQKHIENDSLLDVIRVFDSNKDDVYFIPPGTVHAIGAGNLLTEIQESSDITYRIYDYNRKDKNGKPRELHTHLAKDAIDYGTLDSCLRNVTKVADGVTHLLTCEHFTTFKLDIDGEKTIPKDKDSFWILVCTEGKMEVSCRDGKTFLSTGHSALIPAYAEYIKLKGKGIILITSISKNFEK